MPSAGDIIRAVDIPTGLWSAYTPTWTASTTNPAIGNGSITGRYCQVGDLVVAQGRIAAGSTTTFGSGAYRIGLPVTANNPFGSNGIIGSLWFRDASPAGDYQGQCVNVATYIEIRGIGATYGANGIWTNTSPVTMANGDWASWSVTYEAA